MSRQAKYAVEAKVRAAERYLQGKAGAMEVAAEIGLPESGEKRGRVWAAVYRENGIKGFHQKKGNSSYPAETKQQAAEDYLQGKGPLSCISRKHRIPSEGTLRQWIEVYRC